jgi:hypothetical protein
VSEEPAFEEPAEEPGEEEPRRYPSTVGGALYLAVLGACVLGIVLAVTGDWRLGIRVVAVSLLGAAALRLVLRERDAGMLAVRHKLVDVAVLAAMGALIYFLAVDIPDQPG